MHWNFAEYFFSRHKAMKEKEKSGDNGDSGVPAMDIDDGLL